MASYYFEDYSDDPRITPMSFWVVLESYTPYRPGKLYGPPEFCYPSEPAEVEFYLSLSEDGEPCEALYYAGLDLDEIESYVHDMIEAERYDY